MEPCVVVVVAFPFSASLFSSRQMSPLSFPVGFCTVFFFFDEIFPFFVLIVVWSILVLDRFAFFVTLSPSLTGSFFFGQR